MSYQTVQHHNASPNGEKPRLISSSKRLSWKIMIAPGITISLRKWLLGVSRVTLIGALALSGCNAEHSSEQAKQTAQEKESAATKPVHKQVGEASWYGPGFQGQETSNGDTFDQKKMTAAHPSLPMGTEAKVTNLENGKKVMVRINDRGPYAEGRAIDLSSAAANKLEMKGDGTTQVKIETKPAKKGRTVPSGKTKRGAKRGTLSKRQ